MRLSAVRAGPLWVTGSAAKRYRHDCPDVDRRRRATARSTLAIMQRPGEPQSGVPEAVGIEAARAITDSAARAASARRASGPATEKEVGPAERGHEAIRLLWPSLGPHPAPRCPVPGRRAERAGRPRPCSPAAGPVRAGHRCLPTAARPRPPMRQPPRAVRGVAGTRLGTRRWPPGCRLTHHDRALALANEIGQPNDQPRAHDGLAHAHHALHKHELARTHWQHALDILTRLGIDHTGDEETSASAVRSHLVNLDLHQRTDPQ